MSTSSAPHSLDARSRKEDLPTHNEASSEYVSLCVGDSWSEASQWKYEGQKLFKLKKKKLVAQISMKPIILVAQQVSWKFGSCSMRGARGFFRRQLSHRALLRGSGAALGGCSSDRACGRFA